MTIERKVESIEHLFHQLEIESAQFQQTTKLGCLAGCGKCCNNPYIEASPLEFLPWAFHLFKHKEAESMLETLHTSSTSSICKLFNPTNLVGDGACSTYKYRGLICRLFGNAASRDKFGDLKLVICKTIKESQSANYTQTKEDITKGLYLPIFTDYYMQLNQIDFHLGNKMVPINQALILALEEVLQYYAYREFDFEVK